MVAEWKKCSIDPIYFVENYIKIKDVDSEELVLFKTRFYQKEMVDSCFSERFVIVKLPRQAGKTVCISAILVWHLLFKKNFSLLVAAHKGDKARDVVSMVKAMFENLPGFLQHGVREWNKGSVVLETGSRIRASATSGASARGDTYNMIYLDEMAFVQTHIAAGFIKSVIPTISSGKTTKVFITSTPQGFNHFHKMWDDAVQKRSAYKPIEIKWNDVPGRDEAFRAGVIAEFGQNYFDQEYGAEFLGTGMTLISGARLGSLTHKAPLKTGDHYRIYAEPQKGRQYLMTVDISEGVGGDYSVAMVFDISKPPYEIVAIYENNYISPENFPTVLRQMGNTYNQAHILVETNFGSSVANILHGDLEYENTIWTVRKKAVQIMRYGGQAARLGFTMDKTTKRIGCMTLKSLMENEQLIINDEKVKYQLHRFVKKKESYEAEEGNDDLVICMVSFGWLQDQGYIRDLTDETARQRIMEMNRQNLESEGAIFGFYSDARPELEGQVMGVKENKLNNWMFRNDPPDPIADEKSEAYYVGSETPNLKTPRWRERMADARSR